MRQLSMIEAVWIPVKDGNDTGRAIFDNHYSRYHYADGRKPLLYVGPGEKLPMITPDALALFVWRKFRSLDNQSGINCAVFRNEGHCLSSHLILEAEILAIEKWADRRFYTYVNAGKLSTCKRRGAEYCPWPVGRCFIEAGWRHCGRTKYRKLHILEKILPTLTVDGGE